MKRIAIVAAVTGAVTFALGAPLASSQEAPPAEETTTTVPAEVPTESTTTAPEAPSETTTTTAPAEVPTETTTTTIPETVEVPPVLLFGEAITAGTMNIDVQFEDAAAPDCTTTIPLDGGQMNRVNDLDGDLGLVYGQAATATGTAAVFLMELGVVPAGVGILSIDDATCSLDAFGVGLIKKGPGSLSLDAIGVGVHPDGYVVAGTESFPYTRYGKYLEQFDLTANVGASGGPAALDVASLQSFLLRSRPGLTQG